ncbi:hypothetical protein CR105_27035 [Massilia eurypsychrophila]|uniref:Uncharacterized protein n=1 Tax=Massilia eurypsychrophila TaxID=1485217 RepID=A0A2G8T7I9_9BURK|nr:hypothetical protein [Massilia eurypsychrophila]PIL41933.1 hypothetical protein CR105_27035 [Massilia eurypsychrophila]
MKWLILLMLAGCATKSVTQEVKVPVYAACVKDKLTRPVYETEKLKPESSDGEKVLALARDKPTHLKYEGQLEAVIAGCS